MHIMIRLATLAVASLLLLAPTAFGHTKTALDPDDTSGPLDIVAARHGHETYTISETHTTAPDRHQTKVRLKLITYETWEHTAIAGGKNFAGFEFNLDGDAGIERCAIVDSQDAQEGGGEGKTEYEVRIYEGCNYFDDKLIRSYESGHAGRPDAHSLRVTVPRRVLLGRGVKSYRWRAVTSFQEQDQSSPCPAPDPHGDGGYGTCADFTKWTRHSF
jgi:hypothetical protein